MTERLISMTSLNATEDMQSAARKLSRAGARSCLPNWWRFGFVPSGPAGANDSSASLDAGGLRLTFNPNIRVESEDLYLSRAQVRVHYRFHNVSAQDISTLVAFPLPVMEIGEGGNYVLQGKDPINIMDFQVTGRWPARRAFGRNQGDPFRRRCHPSAQALRHPVDHARRR